MVRRKYPPTIRQPSGRKSPVEHDVNGHTRGGKQVRSYRRGHGSHPQRSRQSVVVGGKPVADDTPMGVHPFTFNFTYSDKPGDGESVVVISDNYEDAVDEAFEEKVDPRHPISFEAIDPDLGAVLDYISLGAKKAGQYGLKGIRAAGKLGAKFAVAGGHVAKQAAIAGAKGGLKVLKGTARLGLYEIEKAKVRRMLKQAFSKDKVEATAARAALKSVFPDIYDVCSFSRDQPKRRRRTRVPEVEYFPTRYVYR